MPLEKFLGFGKSGAGGGQLRIAATGFAARQRLKLPHLSNHFVIDVLL